MIDFGMGAPRGMPLHFLCGALRVRYETAVRSNPANQNRSVCPRCWYVDAIFACARCGGEFTFSAREQQVWYEEYGFWIDSLPKHCLECRRNLRVFKVLRHEYDRSVAQLLKTGDLDSKKRLAGVIDQLYECGGELPPRINENRRRLALQIARADRRDEP